MPMPMDEASRMARAREMGFDTDAYHGSASGDIAAFDPRRSGSVQTSDWGDGVYVSPSQSSAAYYAGEAAARSADPIGEQLYRQYEELAASHGTRPMHELLDLGRDSDAYRRVSGAYESWRTHKQDFRASNGGVVYPLTTRSDNPMYYQYEGITDPYLADSAISQGYDQINVHHALEPGDTLQNAVEETLVFDPRNIRSRFARFDPRLSHLANLSAGAAGGAVTLQQLMSEPSADERALREYLQALQ